METLKMKVVEPFIRLKSRSEALRWFWTTHEAKNTVIKSLVHMICRQHLAYSFDVPPNYHK